MRRDVGSVSLREHLGGRRMVTAPMWAINSCIGVGALTANVVGFGDAKDVIGVFVASSLGAAAAGLVSYVFHLLTRLRRGVGVVDLSVSLSFFVLVSATFFVSAAVMCALLDVPVVQSRAWQVPLQVILGTFWGALAVLILDIRDRAISTEQDAIDHLAQLERVRRAQAGLLSDIDESIRSEVGRQLSSDLKVLAKFEDQVRAQSADVSSGELSQALRTISDNSVRPLSHRMALSAVENSLKPSWVRLWRHAMNTAPLQTGSMVVFLAIALVPNQIQEFGFSRGGGVMALGLGTLAVICFVANRLMAKFPQQHFALMVGAFVFLQLNTVVSLAVREEWQTGYFTVSQVSLHVLFSALFVSVITTFPLWRTSRVSASDYFSNAIQQEQIEVALRSSQISLAAASAAQVLHGEVQSRLLSSALAIERLDPIADSDQLLGMLVDARSLLVAPLEKGSTPGTQSQISVTSEVSRKAKLWKGIVQVSLHFDEAIDDVDVGIAHDAGRVVEEALANSVRHGKAKSVDITVNRGSHGLNIVVCDNGEKRSSDNGEVNTRGMGTALFEAVSDGAWSMSQTSAGTVLSVPIAAGSNK